MNKVTTDKYYTAVFHHISGETSFETYYHYEWALQLSAQMFESHKDIYDWYEVNETVITTKTIKSKDQ